MSKQTPCKTAFLDKLKVIRQINKSLAFYET